MQRDFKVSAWYAAGIFFGLVLSGCSTLSDVASTSVTGIAKLNPFATNTANPVDGQNVAPASTPAVQNSTVTGGKLLLVSTPPVPAAVEVDATLAGNKECTTFCALPVRQPK
ncbi:hypothetical protein [Candidatus Thiothrix anitrata]|jgi:hypothetical protein|uniref:Lipoprotein n=1 Tax=Candidatus Thiothrix anitrata TaxID=2823902 RepID=A0ABX7X1V5_9GAMM|nr:hypothetical protein [Candidatus Thiothrix anitrata]QTR49914.1 hypothetical protein J8380_17105 [Candidatus Thiothrix anitrata]